MSRPSLGPTRPTTLSLRLKREGSEVNTSPTSNAKIKNRWSYNLPLLSLLHITSWHAEEQLCFWGLTNRNRGRCFRNAGSVGCDRRLARPVSTNTNKNSYFCPSSSFVPSPYGQCFDHWCHCYHAAVSTSLQSSALECLCHLHRLERPCLFASTLSRRFQHVYRIPAYCHLLEVTPSL